MPDDTDRLALLVSRVEAAKLATAWRKIASIHKRASEYVPAPEPVPEELPARSTPSTHDTYPKLLTKPKRPMKAKVLYNQRHRPKLRISFPDKDSKEITAMLADQWTKASDEERDYFLAKERALMDQYNKDLAEYEAQSGGSEVLVCTGQPAPLASEGHSSLGLPETSGDVGNVDSSNDVKPKKKKKRRPNYDDVGLDLGLELGESFKKKKKKRRSKSKDGAPGSGDPLVYSF